MRKSKFLSFIFGMIPGAGQMYLGYMKRGASLMGLFCLIIAVSSIFYLGILTIALPVVWFYAFFDTLNLYAMSYDRYNVKDDYLFHLSQFAPLRNIFTSGEQYKIGGICCILFGLYMLYSTFLSSIIYNLFPDLYYVIRRLPTVAIALIIIWFGFYLVTGKGLKHTLFLQDDLKEYNDDEQ